MNQPDSAPDPGSTRPRGQAALRILAAIANFGSGQVPHLRRVVAELRGFRAHVDVVIDSTVDLEIDAVHVRRHSPAIARRLPFAHRRLFIDQRDEYDLYLYLENDVLVPERAVDAFWSLTRRLPPDHLTGFARYEERDGRLQLIDLSHPAWPRPVRTGLHRCNGELLFAPENVHSGCYALTRRQLDLAIRSGGFTTRAHKGPLGMLEQGASDPYTQCGFRAKVLPLDFEPLLVHHLPDKYVRLGGAWERPGCRSVEEFKQMLRDHDHGVDLPLMRPERFPAIRRRLRRNRSRGERVRRLLPFH